MKKNTHNILSMSFHLLICFLIILPIGIHAGGIGETPVWKLEILKRWVGESYEAAPNADSPQISIIASGQFAEIKIENSKSLPGGINDIIFRADRFYGKAFWPQQSSEKITLWPMILKLEGSELYFQSIDMEREPSGSMTSSPLNARLLMGVDFSKPRAAPKSAFYLGKFNLMGEAMSIRLEVPSHASALKTLKSWGLVTESFELAPKETNCPESVRGVKKKLPRRKSER